MGNKAYLSNYLTPSETKVLNAIRQLANEIRYSPSIKEIAERSGYSSTSTVHYHISKLEEKGYIKKGKGLSRALKVVKLSVQDKDTLKDKIEEFREKLTVEMENFLTGKADYNKVLSISQQLDTLIVQYQQYN